MTAAHTAAHWDRPDCLHALLEAGADVSLRAKGAGTAAHVAVVRDNEASLQVVLPRIGLRPAWHGVAACTELGQVTWFQCH